MSELSKVYEEMASSSSMFRETAVSDLASISDSILALQENLQGALAMDSSVFTGNLIEGLTSAIESSALLAETLRAGMEIDLTALGEDGLLGNLALLSETGSGALEGFFGALRDEATQTAEWIGLSGETLLASYDLFAARGEEANALLLEQLSARSTMLSESRTLELDAQKIAQDQRIASLQGFFATSFGLREQGFLSEAGQLGGALESGLTLLGDAFDSGFELKLSSIGELFGLEKENQEGQNAITAVGLNEKMGMAAGLLGSLSSLMESENKNAFEIGKAAAIGEAGINTLLGAQNAYTSLAAIPIAGPALGIAAAAAVIVSGGKTINDIRSQQFKGGGKPKSNFNEVKAKTSAAPKVSSPKAVGLSGAASPAGTAGPGAGPGGPTKIKVFLDGQALIDTTASAGANGMIVVRA